MLPSAQDRSTGHSSLNDFSGCHNQTTRMIRGGKNRAGFGLLAGSCLALGFEFIASVSTLADKR